MGKLKNTKKPFIFCFIVGILVGCLMGGSLMSILISYKLDSSYEKIATLENDISDKEIRLEKLQESVNTMYIVLEDIEVILTLNDQKEEGKEEEEIEEEKEQDGLDEIDEIEIKEAIKEKYNALFGKEVKNIDTDLVLEVVDKRIFKIGNKEFRLKVEKLVLTEILQIWVEVEEVV